MSANLSPNLPEEFVASGRYSRAQRRVAQLSLDVRGKDRTDEDTCNRIGGGGGASHRTAHGLISDLVTHIDQLTVGKEASMLTGLGAGL